MPSSGKVLSGGVDANALQRPKRFFGAARKSKKAARSPSSPRRWSIPAAAWTKVIFEEFKGTGNCEIHLNRRLYEKRVFPAIELNRSGTAAKNCCCPEILQKTRILRQFMYNMDEIESMELMIKKMRETKTNVEFFEAMRRGG